MREITPLIRANRKTAERSREQAVIRASMRPSGITAEPHTDEWYEQNARSYNHWMDANADTLSDEMGRDD